MEKQQHEKKQQEQGSKDAKKPQSQFTRDVKEANEERPRGYAVEYNADGSKKAGGQQKKTEGTKKG